MMRPSTQMGRPGPAMTMEQQLRESMGMSFLSPEGVMISVSLKVCLILLDSLMAFFLERFPRSFPVV